MSDLKITYKGNTYSRRKGQWSDADNYIVPTTLQRELNAYYASLLDLESMSLTDIIKEADKLKDTGSNNAAVKLYNYVLDRCDRSTCTYILPRITSCLRKQGKSREAITLFSVSKRKYGLSFLNNALLVSVAGAYCDVCEYENARTCCNLAFSNGDRSEFLKMVYRRIDKETK